MPPFFAHEGAVLEFLHAQPVPRIIAHDGGRLLTEPISGDDLYDAPPDRQMEMVSLLVRLQAQMFSEVDGLLALGLPDWRNEGLIDGIASVIERTRAELGTDDLRTLQRFLDGLPARFTALVECGLPATLVHGDFHPGNLRGHSTMLTLLDWGDCGVGHPLLDQSAFVSRLSPAATELVLEHWHSEWRTRVPGSRPERASSLAGPLAAARRAVIYRAFLDGIEPSEHPYHRSDPADWLRRTAVVARNEGR